MDVEYYEAKVLKNASNVLSKTSKVVLEWHSLELKHEVTNILSRNEFIELDAPLPKGFDISYFMRKSLL